MGIYAMFWHCHPEGLAQELLSGPLEEFSAWCQQTAADFPDDIEPSSLSLLNAIRARSMAALKATTSDEATAIDRLVDAYFGLFCDSDRRDLKRAAHPSLLRARYFQGMFGSSRETSQCPAAFDLWRFTLTGRGVGRDSDAFPYRSGDGVYRLTYWTLGEVAVLDDAFSANAVAGDVDRDAVAAARAAVSTARAQRTGLIVEIA